MSISPHPQKWGQRASKPFWPVQQKPGKHQARGCPGSSMERACVRGPEAKLNLQAAVGAGEMLASLAAPTSRALWSQPWQSPSRQEAKVQGRTACDRTSIA